MTSVWQPPPFRHQRPHTSVCDDNEILTMLFADVQRHSVSYLLSNKSSSTAKNATLTSLLNTHVEAVCAVLTDKTGRRGKGRKWIREQAPKHIRNIGIERMSNTVANVVEPAPRCVLLMLLPSQALVKANSVAGRLIDPFTEHRLTLPSLSQLPSAPSLSQLPNQGRSALYWRQEDGVGGQATDSEVFLPLCLFTRPRNKWPSTKAGGKLVWCNPASYLGIVSW